MSGSSKSSGSVSESGSSNDLPCCNFLEHFRGTHLTAVITDTGNCECANGGEIELTDNSSGPTLEYTGTGDLCGTGWSITIQCQDGEWTGRTLLDEFPATVISCNPFHLRFQVSGYPDADSLCGESGSSFQVDVIE